MQPCLLAPPSVLWELVTCGPSGPRAQSSLELSWPISLFPQPQLGTRWLALSPSHRWWLTGTLPEDRAAHELEEALGIEAGPVD